jgi:antitoxin component YwqK of YwqJK toxin-antitoxin module
MLEHDSFSPWGSQAKRREGAKPGREERSMKFFFPSKMVFKPPPVSRLIPGYIFSFVLVLLSCNGTKKEIISEPKIAKTVPATYINATDKEFINHQDTVYYKNNFFTGYRYTLYPNGDTASLQSYFNGVEEGTQKKWYPDKQPEETRFYINGKKEGTHEGWWPDGKPKYYFTVDNDEYNGEFKEWYSSGLLAKQFHYVKGREEGSERLWWDNGTVRANYVVKNGKKYGLIGLKLCLNPYDSINKK